MPNDSSISPLKEVNEIKINSKLILGASASMEDSTGVVFNSAGVARSSSSCGTPNTSVTVTEYGDGRHHVTALSFSNILLISPAGAANLADGYLLYTLPSGAQAIKVTYMSVALLGSTAGLKTDTPDLGIGLVEASGAVAVLSGTATFENVLTGQTAADCNSTATVKTLTPTTIGYPLVTDVGGTKTIYLNVADGWAGAGTVTASGVVNIEWSTLV